VRGERTGCIGFAPDESEERAGDAVPAEARGPAMSAGLAALLDDVAAIARVAAASVDDVAAGARRASV
jgi:hypothetical protein